MHGIKNTVEIKQKNNLQQIDNPVKIILSESDQGLFNILRDWRSERCKKEGVPPYIIFNNNQLAEIVKQKPQSKVDLLKISGIGNAKTEKYGEEILKITRVDYVPT